MTCGRTIQNHAFFLRFGINFYYFVSVNGCNINNFFPFSLDSVYPNVQQAEQLTVRDEEQAEQATVQIAGHAARPTVPEGEQAAQPAVQEKEQALQPAMQEEQRAEQPSEREGGHSKRGNEQKHEQFEQQKKTKGKQILFRAILREFSNNTHIVNQ